MGATIFEKDGSKLTVKPSGHIDRIASPKLLEEIKANLSGTSDLVMDFEVIEYISSAGIRIILELYQDMEDIGGSMKIINVSPKVMTVFELVNLTEFVSIES